MIEKNRKIKDILSDKNLREHNSYVEVLAWVPGRHHSPGRLNHPPHRRPFR